MPKIALIQPTQYLDKSNKLCKQKRIHLPGLALPLLAAMVPDNWDVEIYLEVVDEIDFDMEVDLVGIGTMGHAMYRGLDIADEFKKRGRTVVMGGYMASIASEIALQHVDSVVLGDAEISLKIMLADFEKGQLKQIYDYPVEKLEGLPIPRYDLLLAKPIGNMLPVNAGRGCPHACTFCSIACLYKGKYLPRPLDEVIRDIKVVRDLGFKRFYLIDDNIISNPQYLGKLCQEIEPLKMKWSTQCSLQLARDPELLKKIVRSGGEILSFGVESITQDGLDKLNKSWLKVEEHDKYLKILSDHGIVLSSEMILGTDGDTEESIYATRDFVDRNRIVIPRFYILTPIPGTVFYSDLKKQGKLVTENWREYDGSKCIHKPDRISPDRLTTLYWWLSNQIFSFRSIMHRVVLNPVLWRKPYMLLFSLFMNLHYRRYVRRKITPNIY